MPAHPFSCQVIRHTPVTHGKDCSTQQRQHDVMGIPDIHKGHVQVAGLKHVECILEILYQAVADLRHAEPALRWFIQPEPEHPASDKYDKGTA